MSIGLPAMADMELPVGPPSATASPSTRATETPERFGVMDVGSNSIRLVVYDTLGLVPAPVFNERTMCGLGTGLEATGRLDDNRMSAALDCLGRYVLIARELGAADLEILATAAVREATNGSVFVSAVRQRFGVETRILSGEDEARLAALGVIGGFAEVDGVVGDLGGGSLELTEVVGSGPGRSTSMPLGPLRLGTFTSRTRRRILSTVDLHLAGVPWIGAMEGRTVYPVGGAWRTIARAHIAETAYPLQIIHGYSIETGEAVDYLDSLSMLTAKQARAIDGVSRRRADTVPITSLVLKRLLQIAKPSRIVFSAYGVREGSVFERMATVVPLRDPLLESCAAIAKEGGRSPVEPGTVAEWVRPFLGPVPDGDARLIQAACLLADIAWAEHPSYRAEHAFLRVLRMPIAGVTHADRVFLATAVLARHTGGHAMPAAAPVSSLLSPGRTALARRLGVALRLALTLCGGAVPMLSAIRTIAGPGSIRIDVPRAYAPLFAEAVSRRIVTLEAECGIRIQVNTL